MNRIMITLQTLSAIALAGFVSLGAVSADAHPGSPGGAPTLGATGGSIHHVDAVSPYTTDVYTIWFEGGRYAEISVFGDAGTDLDLFVYDEFNNLIAYDNDFTDACFVAFTPQWTGAFRVEIRNLGSRTNEYVLMTN